MNRKSILLAVAIAAVAFATILFAGTFKKGADHLVAKGMVAEKSHSCPGCGPGKSESQMVQTASSADYPLEICVISDEKLGSMGEPYAFLHEGTEVKLCCKACLGEFNRNPAIHLEKISAKSGDES
jgi:hypothetical protein